MTIKKLSQLFFIISAAALQSTSPMGTEKSYAKKQQLQNKFVDALDREDIKSMQQCIDQGADTQTCNERGDTLLHVAVEYNKIKAAPLLLKYIDINTTNAFGATPLHRAVFNCNFNMVEFLVNNGANIEAKTRAQETPLYVALNWNGSYIRIPKFLAEHGANIHAKNIKGRTPLHIVVSGGWLHQAHVLLSSQSFIDLKDPNIQLLLDKSLLDDRLDIINIILDRADCADIDTKNKIGETLLCRAIRYNYPDLIRLLIHKGADVHAKGYPYHTLLESAIHTHGNLEIIKTLIHNGADTSIVFILNAHFSIVLSQTIMQQYFQHVTNYLKFGSRITTAQDPETIPDYLALAIIKHKLADVHNIIDEREKNGLPANLSYYARLAKRVKSHTIERELIQKQIFAGKRPKTNAECAVITQMNLRAALKHNAFEDASFKFDT